MARAVESGLFVSFGVPVKLRTDGGPEFRGSISTLCAAYGVVLELVRPTIRALNRCGACIAHSA